ncbi:coiled-coil domain-containing protein 27 [Rhinoderma darwinii]|uniref:coiled-coil domain-containing protein 27 n=1 Tax=Rhinoderma darwinii TaxID=43563 RepID=UPI003F67BD25
MVTGPKVEMKENPGIKMGSHHELQWMGTRRPQTAVWKIPKSDIRRDNYSKSAREHGHSYEIQSPTFSLSPASSFDSCGSSQVIDLHTSNGTSHGCSKRSTSAFSTDRKLPHIHIASEFSKSNMSIDGSLVNLHYSGNPNMQTYLTSVEIKTPWYISILNEKERCLLKLGEEINRLSRYEVECKRKDQIISNLRNEVSQLQSDVHRSVYLQTRREEDKSSIDLFDHLNSHLENTFSAFQDSRTGVTEGKSQSGSSHKDPLIRSYRSASAVSLAESLSANQKKSQIIQIETEVLIDDITAEDKTGHTVAGKEDEEMSHVSMDQPEDKSQLIQKLQEDMEIIKKDYEMSKGVISCLQKAVSSHESKIRKSASEKEVLQRELKEREIQIQAMSKKFSSLREERKHEELMATLEQENYSFREMMCELKSEVMRRNEMIAELKNEIQRLQKEITKYQTEVRKQEGERSQIKSKVEDLASSEQHVKVALETMQTRFERFRSKILQAAYTAPGFKGPQVEISDNEILETMQKIITDRSDFHQQLKQKGLKVPPLYTSETSPAVKQTSSTSRKKAS